MRWNSLSKGKRQESQGSPPNSTKNTPLLPSQHTAISDMKKRRKKKVEEQKREEEERRPERGVGEVSTWLIRSGGPDLNTPK